MHIASRADGPTRYCPSGHKIHESTGKGVTTYRGKRSQTTRDTIVIETERVRSCFGWESFVGPAIWKPKGHDSWAVGGRACDICDASSKVRLDHALLGSWLLVVEVRWDDGWVAPVAWLSKTRNSDRTEEVVLELTRHCSNPKWAWRQVILQHMWVPLKPYRLFCYT